MLYTYIVASGSLFYASVYMEKILLVYGLQAPADKKQWTASLVQVIHATAYATCTSIIEW